MKVVRLAEVPAVSAEVKGAKGVLRQLVIGSADGSPTVSVRVFTVRPGGHTPLHSHPFEHINFVLAGEGALVRPDGTEDRLQTGDFALVLPGEKHQYRNLSAETEFVFVCVVPKAYE